MSIPLPQMPVLDGVAGGAVWCGDIKAIAAASADLAQNGEGRSPPAAVETDWAGNIYVVRLRGFVSQMDWLDAGRWLRYFGPAPINGGVVIHLDTLAQEAAGFEKFWSSLCGVAQRKPVVYYVDNAGGLAAAMTVAMGCGAVRPTARIGWLHGWDRDYLPSPLQGLHVRGASLLERLVRGGVLGEQLEAHGLQLLSERDAVVHCVEKVWGVLNG